MSDTTTTTTTNPPGAKRVPARVVRGYSRAFTPHGDTGKRYLLDDIPAGLWSAARAKARRQGFSMRALLLHLLTEWLNREEV